MSAEMGVELDELKQKIRQLLSGYDIIFVNTLLDNYDRPRLFKKHKIIDEPPKILQFVLKQWIIATVFETDNDILLEQLIRNGEFSNPEVTAADPDYQRCLDKANLITGRPPLTENELLLHSIHSMASSCVGLMLSKLALSDPDQETFDIERLMDYSRKRSDSQTMYELAKHCRVPYDNRLSPRPFGPSTEVLAPILWPHVFFAEQLTKERFVASAHLERFWSTPDYNMISVFPVRKSIILEMMSVHPEFCTEELEKELRGFARTKPGKQRMTEQELRDVKKRTLDLLERVYSHPISNEDWNTLLHNLFILRHSVFLKEFGKYVFGPPTLKEACRKQIRRSIVYAMTIGANLDNTEMSENYARLVWRLDVPDPTKDFLVYDDMWRRFPKPIPPPK